MFIELVTPIEIIETYIKDTILKEVNENGLLADIQSTKTIFKDLSLHETPSIWIYLSKWNPEPILFNRGNSRAKITFPVEIAIFCNEPDISESDQLASNIQSRVVESLFKNWNRLISKEYNIICQGININEGYSDGKFKVANKQQKIAIKGVLVDFVFELDWIKCLNVTEEFITENNNTDTGEDNNEQLLGN